MDQVLLSLHPLRSFCTVDLGLPTWVLPQSGALPFMLSLPIRVARGPPALPIPAPGAWSGEAPLPPLSGRLPLWVIHRPCSAHYPSPQGTITPRHFRRWFCPMGPQAECQGHMYRKGTQERATHTPGSPSLPPGVDGPALGGLRCALRTWTREMPPTQCHSAAQSPA